MNNSCAESFRRWGYLQATLDPLGRLAPFSHPELDLASAEEQKKWRDIYCGFIGAEFMHMPYPDRCRWVAERMESPSQRLDQKFILKRLVSSMGLERFLHTRYVGTKRFSLEGLASLVPLLDSILIEAAESGFEIAMIGMSHRGRINVMVHMTSVRPAHIFAGFEDVDPKSVLGSGDVKYHLGATGVYTAPSGKTIQVRLASNPSHLESINPVLVGRVRARQERLKDTEKYSKVLAILLHGDGAFAGQGIAAETINLAGLNGFNIGGTVHIIVNNLIGFTANPEAMYSSRFASDLMKRLPVPIFHVNGFEPDAVVRVGEMALDYRKEFKTDVLIDLIGYRHYGHSEVDDPTITQPLLYSKIQGLVPTCRAYAEKIGVSPEELKQLETAVVDTLSNEQAEGQKMTKKPTLFTLPDYWEPYCGQHYDKSLEVATFVSKERLREITDVLANVEEESFSIHPKIKQLLDLRRRMGYGEKLIDWGMAEALAFGSLLWDGIPVRLTGQDCRRGTFSHRHAVLYDINTGGAYIPLRHLHDRQGLFDVFDSSLSEAAAVGFEYGFSRDYPEALVCWEAQFGDFANGAQIIIDQFIAAAEDKWSLLSGLVMLLPHGYEGQGPEHSSARIERYLQLAGEDNFQICYPSTASQYFHLLRRQVLRYWRKPLVVFAPKSMLRAQAASSAIEEFTDGCFNLIGTEPGYEDAKRIIISSGKITHELRAERKKQNNTDSAIVSIEQLYPFPENELKEAIGRYPHAQMLTWVQEEPANMGPLFFVLPRIERVAGEMRVNSVKRSASASPATGSPKAHNMEQETILKLAFANFS